jgi:hypothetical protein
MRKEVSEEVLPFRKATRVCRQFRFSYVYLTEPANQQITKLEHDLTAKYQRFLPSWVKAQPLVVDQVGAAYPLDMRRAIALIYV